jgi:hypothetical protein
VVALHASSAVRDDVCVEKAAREAWEIVKLGWTYVAGIVLGVVAIVEAVEGSHDSAWFCGFWAMTALFLATGWRLWGVVKERDGALEIVRNENSADARAHRLEDLADEGVLIREEIPRGDGWGPSISRYVGVTSHWQLRVDSEVRRSANDHMDAWRQNPPDPTLLNFSSPDDARTFLDFCIDQLRRIAAEIRKS